MTRQRVHLLDSAEAAISGAAEEVVALLREGCRRREKASVALPGGETPHPLYRLLAERYRDAAPWDQIFFFLTDERFVPPDHPQSNYRMVREALLDPLGVPEANRFPYRTTRIELNRAARRSEETLLQVVGRPPRFDLILLGVGEDGHIASLFPRFVPPGERWVTAVRNAPKPPPKRLTLTYRTLNAARELLFLVLGERKAGIVEEIFRQPPRRTDLPVHRLKAERHVWFLDRAAGRALLS